MVREGHDESDFGDSVDEDRKNESAVKTSETHSYVDILAHRLNEVDQRLLKYSIDFNIKYRAPSVLSKDKSKEDASLKDGKGKSPSKARKDAKKLNAGGAGGAGEDKVDGDGADEAEAGVKANAEWSAGENSRNDHLNKGGYDKDGKYIPHENKVYDGKDEKDIFKIHKDLLDLVKSRPDNPNQIVPSELHKNMENTLDGEKTNVDIFATKKPAFEVPGVETQTELEPNKDEVRASPAKKLDQMVDAEA